MKRGLAVFISILVLSSLLGCYEGFDGYGEPEGGTPEVPPQVSKEKPLYYVLLQLIQLDPGAISNQRCFPSSAMADYKKTEWESRKNALTQAIGEASEKTSKKIISVTANDCKNLTAIEAQALDADPWGEAEVPEEDPKGRSIVDLKVVFWDEQPAIAPSDVVTREHWEGASDLLARGKKVVSLAYFVLLPGSVGYFEDWQNRLPENGKFFGTGLGEVDPTEAGINFRNQTISRDTSDLLSWVVERAQ